MRFYKYTKKMLSVGLVLFLQGCAVSGLSEGAFCESDHVESSCLAKKCIWDESNGCLSSLVSSCDQATTPEACLQLYFCGWTLQETCVRSFFTRDEKKERWVAEVTNPDNYTEASIEQNRPEFSFEDNIQSQFKSSDFQQKLDAISKSELSAGNKVEYLFNGDSFKRKLKLIDEAKNDIHAFYFSIACDETGDQLAEALVRAAKRGVNIWIVVSGDWEAWSQTFSTDKFVRLGVNCFNSLSRNGVNVVFSTWLLHEKGLIVDGNTAIVGGQNIANNWALSNGDNEYFRDTDLLVSGPVVTQIEARFIQMLNQLDVEEPAILKMSEKLGKNLQRYENEHLIGNDNGEYAQWFSQNKGGLCRFTYQDPSLNNFSLLETYTFLVNSLQQQLVMQAPQLDMGGENSKRYLLRSAILDFNQKGGRVDVVTNGSGYLSSNIIDTYYLAIRAIRGTRTLNFIKQSIANGFARTMYDDIIGTNLRVYANRRWNHAKVWMFDNTLVSNSSFNFDSSAESWSECALLCMDDVLVSQTKDMFNSDMSRSRDISQLLP